MAREPIHPGETLRDDLEALDMSAAELARRIEVPVNSVTQILNRQRAVTGDTALRQRVVRAGLSDDDRAAAQRRAVLPVLAFVTRAVAAVVAALMMSLVSGSVPVTDQSPSLRGGGIGRFRVPARR